MTLIDKTRAERLVELAHKCFSSDLSEAELDVLRDSAHANSHEVEEAGPRARVSAELIRWLATDPQTLPYIDQRGILVRGVTVIGKLDLWNCRVHSNLRLLSCVFRDAVYLVSAETREIDLRASSFDKGIEAGLLVARGSLRLSQVQSSARVGLIGARIEGDLDCRGARLAPTSDDHQGLTEDFRGVALTADRATIGGAVAMSEGFESSGEVRLVNARIRSDLICWGAKFSSTRWGLSAWRAEIGGAVYLEQGFESSGQVSLSNAKIAGMVSCSGMKISVNCGVNGIGSGMRISEDNASECTALDLNGAEIGDSVRLKDFESPGLIQMIGARVARGVEFRKTKLTSSGHSLWLSASEVGTNVIFGNGFEATGTVTLHGASIAGDLRFFGVNVGGVNCTNMRLEGDLAWLAIKGSPGGLNLAGSSMRKLRDDRSSWPRGGLLVVDNLVYQDLIVQKSPTPDEIRNGLYSNELEPSSIARVEWLKRQSPERQLEPQPWIQLSRLLKDKGDPVGAKRVIREYRWVKASGMEWHPLRWFQKTISAMFKALLLIVLSPKAAWPVIRHPNRIMAAAFAFLEESPARILYTISASLLLGCLIFSHAKASGALAPTEPEAYMAFTSRRPMPTAYPALNPLVYTVENALPLVRLGQDDKWAPNQNHTATDLFNHYWFLMWTRWLLILFGWFQATVLAAALVSRFKP